MLDGYTNKIPKCYKCNSEMNKDTKIIDSKILTNIKYDDCYNCLWNSIECKEQSMLKLNKENNQCENWMYKELIK